MDPGETQIRHLSEFHLLALEPLLDLLEERHFELAGAVAKSEDPDAWGLFDAVEDLAGLAFVACQATINRIYPDASDIKRWDALGRGPTLASGVTVMRVVDAAANLWKHQGEWGQPENAARRERCHSTLRLAGVDGTKDYPLGNLLHVMKDQGVPDLGFLLAAVRAWRDALLPGAEAIE